MKQPIRNALAALTVIVGVAGLLSANMPTTCAQQSPQQTTSAASQESSGAYATLIGDRPFGTETYTISVNPDGTRRSEADVSFNTVKFKATTIWAQNKPVSFTMELGGKRVLTQEFTAQGVKVLAEGQPAREVKAQPSALLENGVAHHFLFMLAQYDAARGGPQSFSAFLPSQAVEFNISIERTGSPTFNVRGQTRTTVHYRAATNLGLALEIWADQSGVPLLISIPSQKIKIIRQGAESLAEVALPPPAAPRTASASDAFTSEEVEFRNGEQTLGGTLTLPKSGAPPFAAAVIISGSGPQDRDGSTIADIYRLIAERLSAAGVAVLRVDDRGTGKSSMPTTATSYRDLVNDTRAAFEFLQARREIDKKRVALVGHSEGALTALVLGTEDARIAAIALLAGASRSVDRVLVEQSLYAVALEASVNPSDTTTFSPVARQLMKVFDDAKASPAAAGAATDGLSWFREHAATDPLALARRVRVPVLILNGERDANVLPYHALELAQAIIAGGNREVTLRIFPNLTHLFTPSRLDKSATEEKAGEVSPDFLRTLQTWATNVLAASAAK